MKKSLILSLICISLSILTSCNGKEDLANNLVGTWASAPSQLSSDDEAVIAVTRIYHMQKDEDKCGGAINFEGIVNVTSALTADRGFLQATTFSASGTIRATGTWEATDDDEIKVYYLPESVTTVFEPQTVLLPNFAADSNDSTAVQYKTIIAQNVATKIRAIFMEKASIVLEMDDIKMNSDKQSFTFELNDKKYAIRRQS